MLISRLIFCQLFWLIARGEIREIPRIDCKSDGIRISVNMSSPFSGRIYLKGHSQTPGCYEDYSNKSAVELAPIFKFEDCHLRRKRETSPAGMKVDTRLIISHHPKVETFRDVAYDIECFYKLQDEMATAVHQLRVVSDLPPQEMRMEPAPPKCTYRVENGNTTAASGELISTVFIGDTVTHVWSCDEEPSTSFQMYCIHVHDCIAKGEDEEISVVDPFGCVTESDLLSPLVHSRSSTRVSAVSRVFKFPNSTGIYFDCQISFTLRVHEESKTCPYGTPTNPITAEGYKKLADCPMCSSLNSSKKINE